MRVAILSDTHIPSRAQELPDWVAAEIRAADHTIHAGDFDSPSAYDRIEELADGDLTAVTGNMDPHGLSMPETQVVEIAGHTFVVTHGTGPPAGYEERVRETARDAVPRGDPTVVAGHTHSLLDAEEGIRILNPGSATGAAPATEATMLRASVTEGNVSITVRRE